MLAQPALVAAKPLLEVIGGKIEALARFLPDALGLEHDPGGKMKRAVCPELRSLALKRNVAIKVADEILAQRIADSHFHVPLKGRANIQVLAGNAQTHGSLEPCF
jgi:hypothetical protein